MLVALYLRAEDGEQSWIDEQREYCLGLVRSDKGMMCATIVEFCDFTDGCSLDRPALSDLRRRISDRLVQVPKIDRVIVPNDGYLAQHEDHIQYLRAEFRFHDVEILSANMWEDDPEELMWEEVGGYHDPYTHERIMEGGRMPKLYRRPLSQDFEHFAQLTDSLYEQLEARYKAREAEKKRIRAEKEREWQEKVARGREVLRKRGYRNS